MFCRNECENGDILVETSDKSDRKGRYSIRLGSSGKVMYVSIRQLKESDTGLYQCVLERFGPDGYKDFRITVTKASLTLEPTTLPTASASAMTELSFSSSSTSESEHQQTMKVVPGPALQDGNTGVVSGEITVYERTEGGTVTVECTFSWSLVDDKKKMFCRNECKNGVVLVETRTENRQEGRYSIRLGSSKDFMSVTIRQLEKTDSGRYQCFLEGTIYNEHKEFEIKVTKKSVVDDKTPKPSSTHRPSVSKRVPTSALTTTSASVSASSELSFSSKSTPESEKQPTPMADKGILLYVGLVLGVIFILFIAALLVLCRNKSNKPKEPQVDMEYTSVAEANIVYDEIKEDRQNQSNPVEISVVHASAKFTTQTAVPTSDIYSLAAAAESQDKTADASETLTYSEVNFSNRTSSSLSSAPQSHPPEVVYSAVSPPLYSTVNQPRQ
ncbi:uncharacterized protein LOC115422341 isoform X2 [Sphaeramia orbicularis]|uniref:uncharacterized protein LOC115422341 isoform X2 n=1 Tax=Sphaeramia orbicularis TaxID=375764 RepID=UPI00117EEB16|nr:uncharacterized protein LOC115422341 isoform X2 [Sphaeramia orbicularis]